MPKFYVMQQLPLGISQAAQPAFDNFIAGRNAEALGERIVYLWGEPGSGRSHLLRAASRLNPGLVVADDVETLDAAGQQALFVAINEARDGGPSGLAACAKPPMQLEFRADLR